MSDFWIDLQAWTQAQVDALLRDSARKRKKNLASDINRLLRDRIAKKLRSKGGKGIAAEFLRTGGRILPPSPPVSYIGSDNGILTWSASPIYPLSIYVGDYLHDYHAAGPTAIPGSSPIRYEYLTGLRSLSAIETCSGGYALPHYEGRESEVSPHDSTVYVDSETPPANPGIIRAEMWSGLMRLWMQARARVGLADLPTIPVGWTADPKKLGLIRSPAGVYWLVQAHSTGIKAARMSIAYPYTYTCTMAIANGGTLSGAAQELADVEALSHLDLWLDGGNSGDPDIVELFASTDTDLMAVYAATTLTTTPWDVNNKSDLVTAVGWGWVWRQQQRGATDEDTPGAAIVTGRPVWSSGDCNLIRRVSTLSITFDEGGNPVGTLTTDDDQAFHANAVYTTPQSDITNTGPSQSVALLEYNGSGSVSMLYPTNAGYYVDATEGPFVLAVFYDSDGELLTMEWVNATEQEYSSSTAEYSQCSDFPYTTGSTTWEVYSWRPAHFAYGSFESGIETAEDRRQSWKTTLYACNYEEAISGRYGCWAVLSQTPGLVWFIEDVNWKWGLSGGQVQGEGEYGPYTLEEQLTRPISYAVSGAQAVALNQAKADAILSAVWADPDDPVQMISLVSYYDRMLVYGAAVPPGFDQGLADDVTSGIYNKALCGWV